MNRPTHIELINCLWDIERHLTNNWAIDNARYAMITRIAGLLDREHESRPNECKDCGDPIPDLCLVGFREEDSEWVPRDWCDECSADRLQAKKEIRQLQRNLP